jgi:hypothetical protein
MTWICLRFAWLLSKMGIDDLLRRPLRLPTDRDFPKVHSPRTVLDYFLRGAELDPNSVDLSYSSEPNAMDGFYLGPKEDNPDLHEIAIGRGAVADPLWLRAMLAHEVSHYWLHAVLDVGAALPVDNESLTDLTSIYLGFGVIAQMTDRAYQHLSQSRLTEYLSTEEQCLALALYLRLKELPLDPVLNFVRPALGSSLKRHLGFLKYYTQIEQALRNDPDRMLRGVEWKTL